LKLTLSLVKTYLTHLAKSADASADPTALTANVLTESAWPAYPLLKDGWAFKLTPELQNSVDEFTKWYATQHKNRQLSWRWQLATVTLTGRFGTGRYEIGVSLFQAVVLMGFNEEDELDFKTIKDRTGIGQFWTCSCCRRDS
jgi:cullin-4